jgi:hypothetical protein
MQKLVKPNDDPESVFLMCISRVRDDNLKTRLTSMSSAIKDYANQFEIAASNTTLHALRPYNNVGGIVTNEEIIAVYTDRMVKRDSPGRDIYDKLLLLPKYGRCPLCGHGVVCTLDHHLPKTKYPTLAVVPTNLVPACRDCNTAKTSAIPITGEEETIHPYFDNIETDLWLYATVIETEDSSPVLRFFVQPPPSWDNLKIKRVKHHFKVFKLSTLYTSQAGTELTNIRDRLIQLFSAEGIQGVKSHLREEADSRAKGYLNSWQTAMYKALAASDWYCSEGFKLGS